MRSRLRRLRAAFAIVLLFCLVVETLALVAHIFGSPGVFATINDVVLNTFITKSFEPRMKSSSNYQFAFRVLFVRGGQYGDVSVRRLLEVDVTVAAGQILWTLRGKRVHALFSECRQPQAELPTSYAMPRWAPTKASNTGVHYPGRMF